MVATQPIPVMEDEETQHIPLDEVRKILLDHTPAQERLAMMTQRMENDKRFDERVDNVNSDITRLGLKPT